MKPWVSAIFRHPVKGLGSERLSRTRLRAGETMPGDREWALAQEGAPIDKASPEWTRPVAFVRGAKAPALMAVSIGRRHDGRLRLSHPCLEDLMFDPGTEAGETALAEWVKLIYPKNRPAPACLVRLPDRGMTDSETRTLTLMSDSSLAALSESICRPLDRRRFRGNIWVGGLEPWREHDLIGREIALGAIGVRVLEPVARCRAPGGNPETGEEDCDVLAHLNGVYGHPNFGVFVEILTDGELAVGDSVGIGRAAA